MSEKYTETKTFDSDRPMTVLGVPGRLKARTICSKTMVGCWENQSWISERRTATVDGETVLMHAEIRFDDECHNGKNSFAITGHGWYDRFKARDWDFGGCCHEMIAQVFPELEPLIQWHLVSSDGPMHYIANTLHMAGDRDSWGRAKGEPSSWETRVQLGDWPITYPMGKAFREWMVAAIEHRRTSTASNPNRKMFAIEPVPYVKKNPGEYDFDPRYSFDDFTQVWHEAPFKTLREAEEFKEALVRVGDEGFKLVKIVTGYSEGKNRELAAARRAANWPEVTDEQLCLPKEELKALLEARLPALLEKFRAAVEGAGFLWSPEDYRRSEEG